MKDDNFLRANNARHMWHPMGHPGEAMEHAPTIITGAYGSVIEDIDGHKTVDAVGGLWCVNLGYSNDVIKNAITKQLHDLPYYSAFAGTSNPPAIEASYMVRNFLKLMVWLEYFLHLADQIRLKPVSVCRVSITVCAVSQSAQNFYL